MGRRGPLPEPAKLRILKGETRPSQVNYREPKPRSGRPVMPRDMDLEAQKVWRRIVREMGETGLIRNVDGYVLRLYCEAVSRYTYASMALAKSGPLVTAQGTGARRGELVKNPLHQIVRDDADLIRSLGRELGLSPAARAGLSVQPHAPVEGGMFGELGRALPPSARARFGAGVLAEDEDD